MAVLLSFSAALPQALAWDIQPHRALYDLRLGGYRSGSSVLDIGGQMMFEWRDDCDGWVIEQRYRMTFLYQRGDEMDVTSAYVTWEAKDGTAFNFSLRNTTNGIPDKELRGLATMEAGSGGEIMYQEPEETAKSLPRSALFPTEHTLEILQRAQAGEHFFSRILFDGTELDGLTLVGAALGNAIPPDPAADRFDGLLQVPAWPVGLAFFSLDSTSPLPDYEMAIRIYANGIVDRMDIDYGSFTVAARLTALEALEAPTC